MQVSSNILKKNFQDADKHLNVNRTPEWSRIEFINEIAWGVVISSSRRTSSAHRKWPAVLSHPEVTAPSRAGRPSQVNGSRTGLREGASRGPIWNTRRGRINDSGCQARYLSVTRSIKYCNRRKIRFRLEKGLK